MTADRTMRTKLGILAALLALSASSCASDGAVDVGLDEFSISLSSSEVESGPQTFQIQNIGDVEHDFVLLRTRRDADDLPVREQEVRTGARGIRVVKEIDGIQSGASEATTVELGVGSHVVICNIPGHYRAGMRAAFRVIPPS